MTKTVYIIKNIVFNRVESIVESKDYIEDIINSLTRLVASSDEKMHEFIDKLCSSEDGPAFKLYSCLHFAEQSKENVDTSNSFEHRGVYYHKAMLKSLVNLSYDSIEEVYDKAIDRLLSQK